jgi:hypothetical protein
MTEARKPDPIYTPSMLVSALSHYDERKEWVRTEADGTVAVYFASSRRRPDGKPITVYRTTEDDCTCHGYHYHHGMCSHLLSVKMDAEQQRRSRVKVTTS